MSIRGQRQRGHFPVSRQEKLQQTVQLPADMANLNSAVANWLVLAPRIWKRFLAKLPERLLPCAAPQVWPALSQNVAMLPLFVVTPALFPALDRSALPVVATRQPAVNWRVLSLPRFLATARQRFRLISAIRL